MTRMDDGLESSTELRVISVKQSTDENDMARLGKIPVLKVRSLVTP